MKAILTMYVRAPASSLLTLRSYFQPEKRGSDPDVARWRGGDGIDWAEATNHHYGSLDPV